MKFEIKSRWSGAVVFTAEIEATEDTPMSIKLGRAVRRAVEAKVSLGGANLRGAYLRGAYLRDAYLRDAYLGGADLRGANLGGANLGDAYLRDAYLGDAYLRGAYLRDAYLRGANLGGADLRGAYLRDANLGGADLRGADLWSTAGNNRHVKTIQAGDYVVTYTDTVMQIGCQRHDIAKWWKFDDARIAAMDGKTALKFWRTWKPILQQIIESSPAEPTGYIEKKEPAAAE